MSDRARRLWDRACFRYYSEKGAFGRIEHASSVKFDDDRQHIVMLQKIWNFDERRRKPCQKERIRAQADKDAENSIRSRSALFIIHNAGKFLAARESKVSALNGTPAVAATLEGRESAVEAVFLFVRFEFGSLASPRHGHPANHDRVIDHIGEHRAYTGRGKDICHEHRVRSICRTGERKQIAEVNRRIADRPRSVNVV